MNEISREPAYTVTELASARQQQKTDRPSWSALGDVTFLFQRGGKPTPTQARLPRRDLDREGACPSVGLLVIVARKNGKTSE